jgi:tetratricopeptide (TPR) repeat protein
LRLRDDQRSLPALYLSAARETHDTHYRATMLVEAAELLLASGAPEDREVAAQTILDALQADPGNPYAVRHLERVLSESVQTLAVKDAVAARAVRAQSDAERALFYLESGELLELAGHDEQARRAYVAALNAMPELTPATMALERVGSGAARRVEAREVRSSVHVLLAEARDAAVRAGTGDGTAGARALRIVAEVLERDAANRDAIALARALASQFADATPVLTLLEAAFRRVNDADLRYELGLFLGQNAARLEQAVAFYEAAATAKPDGRQALRGLVQSYRQLGDDRRAAEATERLLELYDPGEPTAIDLRMGLATFLSGAAVTLPRALDHAKVVLDARPDDARAILLVADLLERSGQRSQAASTLDRLLVRERDREKLHDLWARKARLLASDPAQQAAAIEAVERAAAMNPGNRDTIDLLVDLLERAGQRERVRAYLQPVRSAVQANIARGAVSLRDVRLLGKVAELADPGLARAAERVMYAIEPSSMPPPEGHAQGATATGLQQLLDTAAMREALYGVGEPPQLHELLRALEPVMGRLAGEFPALDRKQVVPMPVSADPSHYTMALRSWSGLLGLSGLELAALPTHNTAVLLDERPPALHLSANLWMQGDGAAWRGAIAVALARHAFGSARARALSPIELDLLLAAAFESVEVFNPITADPDPRRLRELTSQLTKLVPRRQRRVIEKACQALSSWAFDPSATSRALLATDLRLAVLMSGDIAGCLSAACLFDGAAGGSLKQRLTRSRAGQELLGFLLSDEYLSLR